MTKFLKFKAHALRAAITAVIAPPILIIGAVALIWYAIPNQKCLRNKVGNFFGALAGGLISFRTETVYWYIVNHRQGFKLEIKD